MGLLDQVIGSVLNNRMGGQAGGFGGQGGMGGFGGAGGFGGGFGGAGGSSPLVMALMALLGSGALGGGGGGLGGLLGGLAGGGGANNGLGGLLERFQQNGHGDTFQSWVGSGPNRPMASHELGEALGPDTVDQLSQQTGLPQSDLLEQLSHVLPDVVNGMTPQGRMPSRDEAAGW